MKYRYLFLILLNFSVTVTFADSYGSDCQRSSQMNFYKSLIWKSGFIGKDDRKNLTKNLDVVKFSRTEVGQAFRCTGHITCPEGPNKEVIESAGAVCPPGHRDRSGGCAPDRIATAAHLFINKSTIQMREQLDQCEFVTYLGHRSPLVISDLNAINPNEVYAINKEKPKERFVQVRFDKVVVRLAKPIPDCDPYDILPEDSAPAKGDEVIAMTYRQVDRKDLSQNEPLVYTCNIGKVFATSQGRAGAQYSTCDINGGGSGGFLMARDDNHDGRLKIAGIFSSSGDFNGLPYDDTSKDPKKRNYTLSVSTTGDFLQLAQNPGVRPPLQTGENDIPTTMKPTSY